MLPNAYLPWSGSGHLDSLIDQGFGPPHLVHPHGLCHFDFSTAALPRTQAKAIVAALSTRTPARGLVGALSAVAPGQHVEEFDRRRKCDREINVSARNVKFETIRDQRNPYQYQKSQCKHLGRGM